MITKILRLFLVLIPFYSIGQNVNVSGTVTENVTNQPLLGVNIIVKND